MIEKNKLLSFVIVGKNDGYGGNFLHYLTMSIESIAQSVKNTEYENLCEYVVVDWGSGERLQDALCLSKEACKLAKFVYIPEEMGKPYENAVMGMHLMMGLNAGIRRCAGEYIMPMAAKTFFTKAPLMILLGILGNDDFSDFDKKNVHIAIERFNIPFNNCNLDELNSLILKAARTFSKDRHNFGGFGAYLAHHFLFDELRGYHEGYSGYGASDIEFEHRLETKYDTVYLNYYGVICFNSLQDFKAVNAKAERFNKIVYEDKLVVNDADWGFGDRDLEISQTKSKQPMSPAATDSVLQSNSYYIQRWHNYLKDVGNAPADPKLAFLLFILFVNLKPKKLIIKGLDYQYIDIFFSVCAYNQLTDLYMVADYDKDIFRLGMEHIEGFVVARCAHKATQKISHERYIRPEFAKEAMTVTIEAGEITVGSVKILNVNGQKTISDKKLDAFYTSILEEADENSQVKVIQIVNSLKLDDCRKICIFGFGIIGKTLFRFLTHDETRNIIGTKLDIAIYDGDLNEFISSGTHSKYTIFMCITNPTLDYMSILDTLKGSFENVFHVNDVLCAQMLECVNK